MISVKKVVEAEFKKKELKKRLSPTKIKIKKMRDKITVKKLFNKKKFWKNLENFS